MPRKPRAGVSSDAATSIAVNDGVSVSKVETVEARVEAKLKHREYSKRRTNEIAKYIRQYRNQDIAVAEKIEGCSKYMDYYISDDGTPVPGPQRRCGDHFRCMTCAACRATKMVGESVERLVALAAMYPELELSAVTNSVSKRGNARDQAVRLAKIIGEFSKKGRQDRRSRDEDGTDIQSEAASVLAIDRKTEINVRGDSTSAHLHSIFVSDRPLDPDALQREFNKIAGEHAEMHYRPLDACIEFPTIESRKSDAYLEAVRRDVRGWLSYGLKAKKMTPKQACNVSDAFRRKRKGCKRHRAVRLSERYGMLRKIKLPRRPKIVIDPKAKQVSTVWSNSKSKYMPIRTPALEEPSVADDGPAKAERDEVRYIRVDRVRNGKPVGPTKCIPDDQFAAPSEVRDEANRQSDRNEGHHEVDSSAKTRQPQSGQLVSTRLKKLFNRLANDERNAGPLTVEWNGKAYERVDAAG